MYNKGVILIGLSCTWISYMVHKIGYLQCDCCIVLSEWLLFVSNSWSAIFQLYKKTSCSYTLGHRVRGRMVVGFTTTCAISASHPQIGEFKLRSWRDVLDTTVCDKVCQWLTTDRGFLRVLRFPPTINLTATI